MTVVVFLDQHQDIVNVDLYLSHQFDFEYDVVRNIFFVAVIALPPFVVQVLVAAQIVLEIQVGQDLPALELIEGGEQVPHPQDRAKQRDEVPLILLPGNARFAQRKTLGQFRDHAGVSGVNFAVCIGITIIIIAEFAQHHDAAGVGIAKQADSCIHPLLQVAEADDVAKPLD